MPRIHRLLKAFLLLSLGLSHSAQAIETITYYHLDAQGSPVAATNEQGQVIWREYYTPYGERLNKDPAATANTRWYTGHPHDDDTGLTYMGARYYDPTLGRFMAIDPAPFTEDNPHSFNRYAYANNNPYRYVDPDGRAGLAIMRGVLIGANAGYTAYDTYTTYKNEGLASAAAGLMAGGIFSGTRLIKPIAKLAEKVAPAVGDKVYRVWGDGAGPHGQSWSRTDPGSVDNYRDAAGLPNQNSGRFVTEGTLVNTEGVTQRTALPLHGNKGGLDELTVPDAANQVRVDRVSGANPEF